MANKIGTHSLSECTNKITETFSKFFPFRTSYPNSDVKVGIGAGDGPNGVPMAQFQITVTMEQGDFISFFYGGAVERQRKAEGHCIITIASERLIHPAYFLYSVFEKKMIRCMFASSAEAKLYRQLYNVPHFAAIEVNAKFADDNWFDENELKSPEELGYRDIELNMEEISEYL